MELSSQLKYLLRKYPSARFAMGGAFVLLVIALLCLPKLQIARKPVITEIYPPVGKPGDIVNISGKRFGKVRESNYVEFNGNRLTSSSYIAWNDTQIKVILPPNIQDGLVFVGTNNTRSNPAFFANEKTIPLIARQRQPSALPFITEISKTTASPGELLTIYGSNFGSQAETSLVYFSSDHQDVVQNISSSPNAQRVTHIPASFALSDYEYWNDSEIKVFVPDGATSGTLYIETYYGKSSEFPINIETKGGSKTYGVQRSYVVQITADIDNISTKEAATIRFFVPRPITSASQHTVQLLECVPEPAIQNYQNTIVHQLQVTRSSPKKQFSQNFVIAVNEINTSINENANFQYNKENVIFFENTTKPDKCVPSSNEAIATLSDAIVGNEKNPYKKAKLIYNFMIENFSLANSKSKDVLDLIKKKKGDAYDFAIIYTALLRSQNIPSLPLSGILIEKSMQAKNHWWSEFYIQGIGWIPVDVALGAGLEYENWTNVENVKDYYFGNLDAQHIAFSRGWNEIKPTSESTTIVQESHSYALQSIWEEATQASLKYNSSWQEPVVLGIY